jgi:mevalonate kinase
MTHSGSGRGKLILFGEHAAVYGYTAVGTSLPCRTRLSLEPVIAGEGGREAVLTPDEKGADRAVFLDLLEEAAALTGSPPNRFAGTWRRRGDVPRSGGFGSSAALCVALSRVILDIPGGAYHREVHSLANALERRFHGTPSGIDTGMAADSGAAAWTKGGDSLPERRPVNLPPWHLIYGALPRTGSTAGTVGELRRRMESGDPEVRRSMEELGGISEAFVESCASVSSGADFALRAASLTNRAQVVLAELGLSAGALETVLELAVSNGALGGKLSGGGAGGAFYLCARNRRSRDELFQRLPEHLNAAGIELPVRLTPLDLGGEYDQETPG